MHSTPRRSLLSHADRSLQWQENARFELIVRPGADQAVVELARRFWDHRVTQSRVKVRFVEDESVVLAESGYRSAEALLRAITHACEARLSIESSCEHGRAFEILTKRGHVDHAMIHGCFQCKAEEKRREATEARQRDLQAIEERLARRAQEQAQAAEMRAGAVASTPGYNTPFELADPRVSPELLILLAAIATLESTGIHASSQYSETMREPLNDPRRYAKRSIVEAIYSEQVLETQLAKLRELGILRIDYEATPVSALRVSCGRVVVPEGDVVLGFRPLLLEREPFYLNPQGAAAIFEYCERVIFRNAAAVRRLGQFAQVSYLMFMLERTIDAHVNWFPDDATGGFLPRVRQIPDFEPTFEALRELVSNHRFEQVLGAIWDVRKQIYPETNEQLDSTRVLPRAVAPFIQALPYQPSWHGALMYLADTTFDPFLMALSQPIGLHPVTLLHFGIPEYLVGVPPQPARLPRLH